jgi:uncharacterized membrane protein
MKVENFFTEKEKKQIMAAIADAEKNTSGEIRVHLEKMCAEDVFTHAVNVFGKLEMHKTELKNAVLFYLAVQDKKFAIVADKGINDVVPSDFWDKIKQELQTHFKQNNFSSSLCKAIEDTGKQLSTFFPLQSNDTNELSNDISIG